MMRHSSLFLSLAATATLVVTTPAFAGTEYVLRSKVRRLQVGLSTGTTAYPEASMAELDCVPGNGNSMLLEYSHHRYKDVYAMLLAAKSSGQEISFRIQIGSTGCVINYVILE